MTAPPPPPLHQSSDALKRNIEAMERRRSTEVKSASRQDRIASTVTDFTGSMIFVYLHLAIYGGWIIVNLGLVPHLPRFDPSFVILASEASVEAIFLSTFVLISQNRMTEAADKRADLDLHINLLAEHELTKVATLLAAVADHLGIEPKPDGYEEIKQDIVPEAVLDEIEHQQETHR